KEWSAVNGTNEKTEYQEVLGDIRKTEESQRAWRNKIVEKYNEYPKLGSTIESELGISSSTLRSAEKKGWLLKKEQEIYRNPLKDFEFNSSKHSLRLNYEHIDDLISIGYSYFIF